MVVECGLVQGMFLYSAGGEVQLGRLDCGDLFVTGVSDASWACTEVGALKGVSCTCFCDLF